LIFSAGWSFSLSLSLSFPFPLPLSYTSWRQTLDCTQQSPDK
jgi:hypothetical protein